MRSWENPLFIEEKKIGSGFTGPRPKTTVKWTLVLIYARFYITDYSQGKIIFESQMIMVFDEVLEKIYVFLFFQASEEKIGWLQVLD